MEGLYLNLHSLKESIALKLAGSNGKSRLDGKKPQKETIEKKSTPAENNHPKDKRNKKDHEKNNQKSERKNDKRLEVGKYPHKSESSTLKDESEEAVLRREAMALGATEEDLRLVEGIEFDDLETEFDSVESDETLNSDLSKFIKGLDLPGAPLLADEDEAEIEEEEEAEKAKEQEKKKVKEEKVLEKVKPKQKKGTKGETEKVTDFNFVKEGKLKLESRIDWYNLDFSKEAKGEKLDRFSLERLADRGQALLEKENKTYLQEFSSINSQRKFLSQILSDGTLNDKISALTLLIQEAPLHNIKAFDTLLGFCEKKSRTAALQAINAMADLFINGLLPDRKLFPFSKQPLTKATNDEKLALYLYEDHLKKGYFKFIQILELLSHDSILHVRMNVILHIFNLLKAKPEQEANLLRLGVNKLGDNDNKVAAKTSYQILQLEEAHPAMKSIITSAVVDMVLQKSTDHHSQYYTILTLNQTILSHKDVDLANSLIKAYFSIFEKILVESDPATMERNVDKSLGKSERGRKNNRKAFKKGKKGGVSVKDEEKTEGEIVEERSAKMFSALLTGLNRAFPYADLPSDTYLCHLNTLYKITHSTNFNTSIQALVLVQHVVKEQDLDSDRYYRTLYESLMDPRLVNSSKQGIYLNLLFKSLKNDIKNVPRILAFVKRILQVCTLWLNVGAIAGMLYLLMELTKTYPQILDLMEGMEARVNLDMKEAAGPEELYDPKKRNPTFANADKTCFWEIAQFLNHYHPTIAVYAQSFIDGTPQHKPDLGLYTQAHFLDRFVYKNAKQKETLKGSSIMQPLGGSHTGNLLVRATNVKSNDLPANTVDWLTKKAGEIRPDEKFFYDYFINNAHKSKHKKSFAHDAEGDESKGDLGDTEVWDALVKLKPDVEGTDDSDLDAADFSDMSDFYEEDKDFGASKLDEDVNDNELEDGIFSDDAIFQDQYDDELDSEDAKEDGEADNAAGTKREAAGSEYAARKKKRAKFLNLPTFASTEEYSQYLQSDDEY